MFAKIKKKLFKASSSALPPEWRYCNDWPVKDIEDSCPCQGTETSFLQLSKCDIHSPVSISSARQMDCDSKEKMECSPIERHLILLTNQWQVERWPSDFTKISDSTADVLQKSVKEMRQFAPEHVLVTACFHETRLGHENDTLDIVLMPDYVVIRNVSVLELSADQKEALFQWFHHGTVPVTAEALQQENIWIVCAHKSRDKRCGDTFAPLTDAILHHTSQTQVWWSSHVGGHKYAGNVIIYPLGLWLGRVVACHIAAIIEALKRKEVYSVFVRGWIKHST